MKTKVFWTKEEFAALGVEVDRLMHVVKGYSYLSALTKAQLDVLPEPRRRQISFWAGVRDRLTPYIEQAKKERESASGSKAGPSLVPPVAPSPATPPLSAVLANEIAPFLASLLSHPQVQAALTPLLERLLPGGTYGRPLPTPVSPPHISVAYPPRPKLLIAGLLNSQAEEIKKDYAKLFDLRFWCSDESKEHLRTLAKNSEIAVGVTNFIGHPADALLKSLSPHYVRHSGGVKTLKATLAGLSGNLH